MPRDPKLVAAEKKLAAAQDKARRHKLGKPLDWTDAQLDQLATVTDADQASAAAYWRRNSPPWAHGLIDAEPVEPDA